MKPRMEIEKIVCINKALRSEAARMQAPMLSTVQGLSMLLLIQAMTEKRKTRTVMSFYLALKANGRSRAMKPLRKTLQGYADCELITIKYPRNGQMYWGSVLSITEHGKAAIRDMETAIAKQAVKYGFKPEPAKKSK